MIGMMISQKTPYAGKNPLHRGHHLLCAAVLANPIAILITEIIGLAGVLSREPAEWLALGTPVHWPAVPRWFLVRCWRKERSSPLGAGCFEMRELTRGESIEEVIVAVSSTNPEFKRI
jgi:hypothetical protein